MRVIPKDKVIFSFNAEHPCQYSVEDGETFWVETDDCYSGQITDASVKRHDHGLLCWADRGAGCQAGRYPVCGDPGH